MRNDKWLQSGLDFFFNAIFITINDSSRGGYRSLVISIAQYTSSDLLEAYLNAILYIYRVLLLSINPNEIVVISHFMCY